jgi:acyl-CoA dehydrogenase
MAWDFETDPEYQKKLDWVEEFVENEVEPLTHLGVGMGGVKSKTYQKAVLWPSQTRLAERKTRTRRSRAGRLRLPGTRYR